MIRPEIRLLRAFVCVAEELHFGRAATRLNIVQPALSAQIRTLEELLSVQLLHRTRRLVELTEPGRLFLEESRRILAQLDRAVDLVQRAGRGQVGRLAIGYSAATAQSGLLSRTLHAFHQDLPDVTLVVRELHPALQRKALLTGELDVGFVVSDTASLQPEFGRQVVEEWGLSLVLPAAHPLAGAPVVPLDALRNERFISYSALGEDLGVQSFQMVSGFAPWIVQHADSPVMLLSLVSAGLGIATVPTIMQNSAIPGLAFRQADRPFPSLPVAALFRADDRQPALARFLERLPPQPGPGAGKADRGALSQRA